LSSQEIETIAKKLVDKFRVYGIVLFGSRARGDYKPWSDYDLLIVGDFKEPYLERLDKVFEALKDTSLPVEPHPYTLGEALEMLKKGNPLIVAALSEGIELYITPEFELLKNTYMELVKRGLKRTKISVIVPSEEQR